MKTILNLPVKAFNYVISLIAKDYPKPGEALTQFWHALMSMLIITAFFVTLIYI